MLHAGGQAFILSCRVMSSINAGPSMLMRPCQLGLVATKQCHHRRPQALHAGAQPTPPKRAHMATLRAMSPDHTCKSECHLPQLQPP